MNANKLVKALLLGYAIIRTDKPVGYSFKDQEECLNLITFTPSDPNDYHAICEIEEDLTDGRWIIGSFR